MKKKTISITAGLFLLLLSACGSNDTPSSVETPVSDPSSSSLSEQDAAIMEYSGDENSSVSLTFEQAEALLADLGKIHPELAEPRELSDARSTCGEIREGRPEEDLVANVATRFGNGSDRIFNESQATQILEVIRANGFCAE